MTKRIITVVSGGFLALGLSAGLLAASPFTDAEAALRDVYGDYRVALFQSNAGNGDAVDSALEAALSKWTALEVDWTAAPPPQYAADPKFDETLAQVRETLKSAQAVAATGALAEAHEELEGVRDAVWRMHSRNGIIGFSDRMNTYHAKMEEVLSVAPDKVDEAALPDLLEQAAVLNYLAADVAANPAPEAGAPGYQQLVDGMTGSAAALLEAARAGDIEAVKTALSGLKPAYARLFAKYG